MKILSLLLLAGVLLAAATVVLMWPVATWLQRPDLRAEPHTEDIDAVYLVAGARAQDRRIRAIVRFVSAAPRPVILVGNDTTTAGWSGMHQRNLTVGEWAGVKLREACPGVPVETVPGRFAGTDGEMAALAEHLRERPNVKRMAVVTSPFHVRRAVGRLRTHLDRDVEITVVAPEGTWHDRAPWVVILELAKMARDALGLSRARWLSRER